MVPTDSYWEQSHTLNEVHTQTEEAILKTAIQKVFAKHTSDVMAATKKRDISV